MTNAIVYRKGDATQPVADGTAIIVHICNDAGGWGRGFVLALSRRWKEPEQQYRQWFKSKENFALGQVQLVQATEGIWVANLVGQHGMSPDAKGNAPVRYEAIAEGLVTVAAFADRIKASVHMPRIGCGLAGGTWDRVEPLITTHLLHQEIPVTVYDL